MRFLQIFFLLFLCNPLSAQISPLTANQGTASEKEYLSTIPYKELKGKMIVQATINGKTYHFVLDTGAPMVLSKRLSSELNLPVQSKMEIIDQSGLKDSMEVVSLPRIKIGEINFNDTPALVSTDPVFDCLGIDGLIGSNILRNSTVQFSSRTKSIIITNTPKLLHLKSKYASKMYLDPVQSNPFIWINQKNGKVKAREQLLFDTGMDELYAVSIHNYKKFFDEIGLFNVTAKATGTFTIGIHGNATENENYRFLLPELSINKTALKNVTTETTYDNNSRVGAKLLEYGVATVDYINKRFYFEPFDSSKSFDLTEKSWPFSLIPKDNKMVVGIVWDERYREEINLGDEVIKINEVGYENMSFCELLLTGGIHPKLSETTIVLKDPNTGTIKSLEIRKE